MTVDVNKIYPYTDLVTCLLFGCIFYFLELIFVIFEYKLHTCFKFERVEHD